MTDGSVPLNEMNTEREISTLDVGWRKGKEITSSDMEMLKWRCSAYLLIYQ